ncbi:LytR/AlgR family response regulator transcription factor [Arhodomonas sp. SL1]|uniref:LytR/AlgR family response regulator transcription factor n=1 Tax=Arhodomonas sp. SL1 TaxID=3425691 RepID=UPI003F883909
MKILVVDDEAPARQRLAAMIAELGDWEVAGEAADGDQALAQVDRLRPDVVLLDIRMPGPSGLEVAARLSQMPHPPAVIFVTAHGDHALQAFETAAIDYLLKPVRSERLAAALERAQRLNRAQLEALQLSADNDGREHILCRRRSGIELIPVDSVRYFMADQKYVTVNHERGEDLIEDSLRKLEDEFKGRFVRIHRKALVSRDRLVGLEKGRDGRTYAVLEGTPDRLEVSRRHLPQVRGLLRAARVS